MSIQFNEEKIIESLIKRLKKDVRNYEIFIEPERCFEEGSNEECLRAYIKTARTKEALIYDSKEGFIYNKENLIIVPIEDDELILRPLRDMLSGACEYQVRFRVQFLTNMMPRDIDKMLRSLWYHRETTCSMLYKEQVENLTN